MWRIIVICSILLACSACSTLVTGSSVTNALVGSDKRNIKTIVADHKLQKDLKKKLNKISVLKQSHIELISFNRVILLIGETPEQKLREKTELMVKQDPRVKRVYNALKIAGPSSILSRSSDAVITAKVKTKLLSKPGIRSGQIKLITENGYVYLMGLLNRNQSQLASETARKVGGVQKVITLFEFV